MIHAALDLSNLTLVDTEQRLISIDTGSLTGTYRDGKLQFSATIGTRHISLDNRQSLSAPNSPPGTLQNVCGFLYSGGLRYDPSARMHFIFTTGQDMLVSPFHGAPDYSHYVRLDVELNLI